MKFGCHVSISGSIDNAFDRALERGCDTFQIFVRNPRGWNVQPLEKEAIERFEQKRKETGLEPVVVHITYLPNLASPERALYVKSVKYFVLELGMAEELGADYFVVHLGHRKGSPSEEGVQRVANAVNNALAEVSPRTTKVLLENTAGTRGSVGDTFEELGTIFSRIRKKSKVGLCFDTCHAYCAGYNIASRSGLDQTLKLIDETIGLERLMCVHANDSKNELDSHRDRHEDIGEGFIGDRGFRVILAHPFFRDKPFILETPVKTIQDDLRNLKRIRNLVGSKK